MEVNDTLVVEIQNLIGVLSQKGEPFVGKVKKDEKESKHPRDVTTHKDGLKVDELGDGVKKFFAGLFKFEQPEVKKEAKKKSSFWLDIVILLGGALLGVYSYFKKTVFPYFFKILTTFVDFFKGLYELFKVKIWKKIADSEFVKAIEGFFKNIGEKFEEIWVSIKESKFAKTISEFVSKTETAITDLFKTFTKIFTKEGMLGKLFSGEFIKTLVLPLTKFFAMNGPLGGIFSKMKIFAKIFEKLSIFLVPIFALFNFKAGWDQEMKSSGDKAKAVGKGLIAFAINLLTLGFIDFDDIKKSIDRFLSDFDKGNYIQQIVDVLILIPEAIIKIPVKIIGWIVGLFNAKAGANIADWVKNFSLGETLEGIGTAIGDWIGDYIIAPIMNLWFELKDIFTRKIPDAFKVFFKSITDFFDMILNFDFTSILDSIPGVSSIRKLFSKKGTAKGNETTQPITPAKPTAQDYISRPGQPVQQFSNKDTVVGFKEGGPILNQLTSAASSNKKVGELNLKAMGDQINALNEIRDLMKQLVAKDSQTPSNNVVIANKASSFNMPALVPASQFRTTYLGKT